MEKNKGYGEVGWMHFCLRMLGRLKGSEQRVKKVAGAVWVPGEEPPDSGMACVRPRRRGVSRYH